MNVLFLRQIENEYGNIMWAYKDAGKAYVKWCAEMAVAQNIGVPWIMCQQADAPQPMVFIFALFFLVFFN